MELELKNKNAVITGGSKGVGKAAALALAREGVNLIIAYNSDKNIALLLEELTSLGVKAYAVQADLADSQDTLNLMRQATDFFGNLDILINNAGMWPTNFVEDITLIEWQKTFDVNLTASFLTCQYFIRQALKDNRPGKILNVSSQAAINGSTTGHAHYAASKSALINFTISLAREMKGKNINVNSIVLGLVETDMISDAILKDRQYYEDRTLIGRIAAPEEIAEMIVFMVSKPASYLTGSLFDATGGMITR